MIDIKYNNINLSEYNTFLNECSEKDYTAQMTHNHHILPKFMGGNNDKTNLIKLSYKDHRLAHEILAECFIKGTTEYNGNIWAAICCDRWATSNEDLRNKLGELVKQWHAEKKKLGIPYSHMLGKSHSTETKKKMSESKKGNKNSYFGRKHTEEIRKKISNNSKGKSRGKGRIFSEEHKLNMSESKLTKYATGEIIPYWWLGKPGKRGGTNGNAKKVKCNILGRIFDCVKDVKEYYNLKRSQFNKKISLGELSYI